MTRRVYRRLGNRFGHGYHTNVSKDQIEQGLWLRQMIAKHLNNFGARSKSLELGTGWTHFYGLFLRLFYESELVAFDVQDNRQLDPLKQKFAKLADLLSPELNEFSAAERESVRTLAKRIASVDSFEELYRLVGMKYVLAADGNLESLESAAFDVVFSMDVLEHVRRESLTDLVRSIHRLLKPGGISVHQIGIDDHLSHYVPLMSTKNYMRYSKSTWQLLFENKLQYFNRLQMSDFEERFAASGFELLESNTDEESELMTRIIPHREFQHYDLKSLRATRGYLVHRKASA